MDELILEDARYPLAAFGFLHDALGKAVADVHGQDTPPEQSRHVSGQQLCFALRDLAVERWGMLARTVLDRWNIHQTLDFGNMVYLLIEHGYMNKTEEDSIEDFRDVFDFEEAFNNLDAFEIADE
jgi:uncharacterized repeat protein (TIGR04138 family)